jgi:hypothetical protein
MSVIRSTRYRTPLTGWRNPFTVGGMESTTITPSETVAPDLAPVPTLPVTAAEIVMVPTFVAALKATLEASSKDGARPVLNGVRFSGDPVTGELVMVATDSYRLHEVTLYVSDVAPLFATQAILPRDQLAAVVKLLSAPAFKRDRYGSSGRATVSATWKHELGADDRHEVTYANHRTFTFGDHATSITVGEVPGDYPNVGALMFDPDAGVPSGAAAFNTGFLAGVAKAAGFVAGRDNPIVRARGHRPCPGDSSAPNYRPELNPAMFTATGDGLTFRAILMPVRVTP